MRRGTKRGTCTVHKGEANLISRRVCVCVCVCIPKCKQYRDGKNNFGVITGHIEITC